MSFFTSKIHYIQLVIYRFNFIVPEFSIYLITYALVGFWLL